VPILVRKIRYEELSELLVLYRYLHPEDPEVPLEEFEQVWGQIYQDPNLQYVVLEENGKLVSSCTVAIIRNLTRRLRPYALIENVITHPDARGKGYGTAVLREAAAIAGENNCYKVMLLTGSNNQKTLDFYEKAGFRKGVKTGFIMPLDGE